MKVVMTLVLRDEADIVDAQIAHHLNAGVDFVLATDHDSQDGTSEILESYAREGYLEVTREAGALLESDWRTRMARLAAVEHGADWVINSDADEFWMTRGGTLKEVLAAIPPRFGVVSGVIVHFVPRPSSSVHFSESMTVRLFAPAPINDPTSPWRPSPKVVHRADPDVSVQHAAHTVHSERLELLPGWCPFDVLHFPCRSLEQWTRKTVRRAHGDKPLGQYVKGFHASQQGTAEALFRDFVVDDETLEAGCASGFFVIDTRLRDILRTLRVDGADGRRSATGHFRLPSISTFAEGRAEERSSMSNAFDAAALREGTLVRLSRRLDDLGARLAEVEERRRGRLSSPGSTNQHRNQQGKRRYA